MLRLAQLCSFTRERIAVWPMQALFSVLLLCVACCASVRADYQQPSEPWVVGGVVQFELPAAGSLDRVIPVALPPGVLGPLRIDVMPVRGASFVSEGSIEVDGIRVAGPNDFALGAGGFNRSVDIGPGMHRVRFQLSGNPGNAVRIVLTGRKLLPVPVKAEPASIDTMLGATTQLAVTLSPPPQAPGRLTVVRSSSRVWVPASVAFDAGQTRVLVPVKGVSIGSSTVSAMLNGISVAVPVRVRDRPARVVSLAPPQAGLQIGSSARITVALDTVQTHPVSIALSASPDSLLALPDNVTVPAGALSASFMVTGRAEGNGQITARLGESSVTSQFSVVGRTPTVVSVKPVTSSIAVDAAQTLSVHLSEAASAATTVALSASPAGLLTLPASVVVPAGAGEASFQVSGRSAGTATVRAGLNDSSAEAAVHVVSPPARIQALEPPRADLIVGAATRFTLRLNSAQLESIEVALAVIPAGIASTPARVVVPAGQMQAAFDLQALTAGIGTLRATLNGESVQSSIVVVPPALALVAMQPSVLDLQTGASGTLTLSVNAAQSQPADIALTAVPEGIVQLPATVQLPAGQTQVDIPLNALAEGEVTVLAGYAMGSVESSVRVSPPPPQLASLLPADAVTPRGRPIALSVKLDRMPSQPVTVSLSSSAPDVAAVPATVVVPAGSNEASFAVLAAGEGEAVVTASLDESTVSANVQVGPAQVVSLALSPQEHTAYVGDPVQYLARGTFTDATERDVSDEVLWLSSRPDVAEIGATGVAHANAAGSAEISATADGTRQSTPIKVLTPPALGLSATRTRLASGDTEPVTLDSGEAAGPQGLQVALSGGGTATMTFPATVTIPAGQRSVRFNVSAQSAGAFTLLAQAPRRSDASLSFVIDSGIEVTALNPAHGEAGSLVDIVGRGFSPDLSRNLVRFADDVAATVVEASAARLRVKVPALAKTGELTVVSGGAEARSPVFTVDRPQDFSVSASPAGTVLLAGSQAVVSLALSSQGSQPFTGVAALSASGLPPGVTARFSPANLALDQAGSIVLTAEAGARAGIALITVEARSLVSGVTQTRTAQFSVDVRSAEGVTGVKGRFTTPEGVGIAGIRVNVDANVTVSDAAGNFLLTGLPAGKVTLRFDATPAHPLYPIWPAIVELETGKLTVLPDWPINPPPADEKFSPIANAVQDQVITDPRYPGVEVRLPAGVSITGWDGVRKSRLAVERIEANKLPVPLPPVPTREHYQLYFGTPMGGIPDQPIPVSVPNVTGLGPGEKTEIWYFDGSPMNGVGEWKVAGTATVSDDGQTVGTDPGQGIPRFCGVCGLFAARCPPLPDGDPPPPCPSSGGNPVELYTGYEKPNLGGLQCSGLTPLEVGLSYSPVDIFQGRGGLEGSFGQGWFSDYEITLASSNQVTASKRLMLPGGSRINFVQQPDGAYRAPDDPRFEGAALKRAGSAWELKLRDGTLWRFGVGDEIGITAFFLTEVVDPQGNAKQIGRRSDYKIASVGTAQRAHRYSYGSNGLVNEITDPAGRSLRFTYNAARRIETATDADGGVTRYSYVDDNEYAASSVCTQGTDGLRIKSIQYPGIEIPTENHHGTSRRVLRQTSRLGEWRFAYTVTGACITHVSTPDRICTANCPHEDSWEAYEQGWRFHGGQVVATRTVEPSGREVLRRFNARGVVTELSDPDGVQMRSVLNRQNRVVQRTDLLGRTTRYAYDEAGNAISEQDHLGRVTDRVFDPKWNRPTRVTRYLEDGSAIAVQTEYHASHGQVTRMTDGENRATVLAYTARGQLQAMTDALGNQSSFTYDDAGDLIRTRDPLGHITRLDNDGAGRPHKVTTPKGYDWLQSWNGASQPRVSTDPLGGRVEYIYDAAQRLSAVIDQNGHPVERYAYDERGNLASLTDALGRAETHEYDEANRRIRTTLRNGEVIGYAYDSQNRPTEVVRGDSRTHYSYDALGRPIQIDEGGVRLQYDWDSADRLVREVQDSARGYHSIEYRYDALDRRIARTVGGRDETRYVWNKAGQIAEIHYRGEVTRYDYDSAGRLARKTLPGGSSQTYTLDAAGRLTRIEYHDRSGSLTDRLDLAHDAEGHIVRKTLLDTGLKQDSAFVAEYDDANRMTRVSIAGKTWSLSYDANGNLVGKTNVADAGDATRYTWDSRNRLIALDAPGLVARFEYDPLGRRIARTVNGQTTAYLYDGAQAIGEIREAQTTAVLTGVAIDEALARYAGSGRLEQLTDHLGSVIRRIGEDGSTRSRTAYSPYGESSTTGDAQGDGTGYTGREDDGTGLYFYRARYYDPVLGRFVSEDPIGVAGGINTYLYANTAPTMYTDPDGLTPAGVAIGIGVRVIGGRAAAGAIGAGARSLLGPTVGGIAACVLAGVCTLNEGENPPRGLPPEGVRPPVEGACTPGPASRPSERDKGGQSLWDPDGGEWRWFPGDKWHNPHWDHNPHDRPSSPWVNIPHGGLPPVKSRE